jgi:hypothetical protein
LGIRAVSEFNAGSGYNRLQARALVGRRCLALTQQPPAGFNDLRSTLRRDRRKKLYNSQSADALCIEKRPGLA